MKINKKRIYSKHKKIFVLTNTHRKKKISKKKRKTTTQRRLSEPNPFLASQRGVKA